MRFFSANNRLIKQIGGCPIGGPISVVLLDPCGCKMEQDIVTPSKPLFYKHYMEYTYVRTKKNETDELYNTLNSYHQNIKLTLQLDPTKFLDIEIIRSNGKLQLVCIIKWRSPLYIGYQK